MSRSVTLTTLQTRVKQRANLEVASSAVLYTTSELTDLINEGIAELYQPLTSSDGQTFYLESTTFTTNASTDTYAIGTGQPINVADFYKLRGVDITFGQNIVNTARPFMWNERNKYKWLPGWIYTTPVAYRMVGSGGVGTGSLNIKGAIKLIPSPPGQFNITVWYVPVPPVLVSGSDAFDGVDGFEEAIVCYAAARLLLKQRRFDHATVLQQEMERQLDRARAAMGTHDEGEPERVTDVLSNEHPIMGTWNGI